MTPHDDLSGPLWYYSTQLMSRFIYVLRHFGRHFKHKSLNDVSNTMHINRLYTICKIYLKAGDQFQHHRCSIVCHKIMPLFLFFSRMLSIHLQKWLSLSQLRRPPARGRRTKNDIESNMHIACIAYNSSILTALSTAFLTFYKALLYINPDILVRNTRGCQVPSHYLNRC